MTLAELIRENKHALDVKQLADILNVNVRTIYRDVETGGMPFFRVRNGIRFDPEIIADWLEARIFASTPTSLLKNRKR